MHTSMHNLEYDFFHMLMHGSLYVEIISFELEKAGLNSTSSTSKNVG